MDVVLCDLDDTLFDHQRATREALAMLRADDPTLSRWTLDDLHARHRQLLERLHADVLAGHMTVDAAREERFRCLLEGAGEVSPDRARRLAGEYREAYEMSWYPVAGALEFAAAIRRGGQHLVIVTNNHVAEQQLKLDRCGFSALVNALVTSEEVGHAKPAAAMFRAALDRVDATLDDAVMLGDAWHADVDGARGAGIAAVWFNPGGHPSPDASVPELRSLQPVASALGVLNDARRRRPDLQPREAGRPARLGPETTGSSNAT